MHDPLLLTKLSPPPPRRDALERPRLQRELERAAAGRLTLIAAPAGYGKTTLLAGWLAARRAPVAWLSLDADDNAPLRFLRHLAAALQRVDATLAALGDFATADGRAVATTILNDVLENEDDLVLVLDDYHEIESAAVHDTVELLVERAPPKLHVVLASRGEPPLPLARWRLEGALRELRADDLRFTAAEARAFAARLELELSPADGDALARRTEGWAAGLQLAALSLRGRDRDPEARRDAIERFTGTDRYVLDYLTEEVLLRQPEDVQDFLLMTSVLDRFDAALAAAVTGRADAAEVLAGLERAGLFLQPTDDRRSHFRFHASFRDLLRRRLRDARPDLPARLHGRAARHLEAQGRTGEALRHALLAGDVARAATLVEAHPRARRIRTELLAFLGRADADLPLAALLEEALARGVPLEQRSRLVEALERPPEGPAPGPGGDGGRPGPLSERELDVLRLIAAGLSNKQVARRLELSPETVKSHARNLYGKLGVRSRTAAAARARALGLL